MTELGRSKIIMLDDRFPTGEPTIQPVVLWGLRGKPCYETLSKEASSSPARQYIQTVEPTPGRTIVLVIGLGSFEYYGLNRNGDGFNEVPFKPGCSNGPGRDAWVMEDECIQHHYKTYEQGHVFRHHVNKDPKRAVGKILKAFWNPFMHRVEVLEDIDNAKAPDLVEQIADGEFPAKSMGCRIKFDVCTKCGNRAPTRKQYCPHLKFQMNYLESNTGIRYGALNPSPRFFDSSWVIRPADRTGYMLKKVAMPYEVQGYNSSELGELVDDLNAKSAAAHKLAVIDKVVRGYPAGIVSGGLPEAGLIEKYRETSLPSVVANTSELSSNDLACLAVHNLGDVLAALSRSGILLTTPEFIRLFMAKAAPGVEVPQEALDNMVALQSEIFELLKSQPSMLSDLQASMEPTGKNAAAIDDLVRPLVEKRADVMGYLKRQVMPRYTRHGEAPTTDMFEVVNPQTGTTYRTTRGAADAAQTAIDEANLKRYLGAGGLMAGAWKTIQMPGLRLLSLPLAGLGTWLGYSTVKPKMYETTTGEQVPHITEMQYDPQATAYRRELLKEGSLLDVVNNLGMDYQITKTGSTVLKRVAARATQPLSFFLDKQASFGMQYPHLTLTRIVTAQEKLASDGITEERIDLDKVATIIGALALETP
jgi:hypothetical protein